MQDMARVGMNWGLTIWMAYKIGYRRWSDVGSRNWAKHLTE